MRSESFQIHQTAVKLFEVNRLQANLDFEHRHKAIRHKAIIERLAAIRIATGYRAVNLLQRKKVFCSNRALLSSRKLIYAVMHISLLK